MRSFTTKVIKGYAWVGSTRAITRIFSLLATIILARLLTPEDFGLIGMAMVFIGFVDHFNQLGISAAIIQTDRIDDSDLFALLCLMLVVNGVMVTGTAVASPYISSLYGRPELTPIILVLSTAFMVSGFRIVPEAVLTKNLAFDKLAKAEIAGGLTALVVGPALAFTGFRVWALVAAILVNHSVVSAITWWYRPIRLAGHLDLRRTRRFLAFGLHVTGARFLWYIYTNADKFVIGKFLGASVLGIYEMTWRIVHMPVKHVTNIANNVSYPAYATLQKDTKHLREHFLAVTKYVGILSLPALAALMVVREDFVMVLLSETWQSMLSVFSILALLAMVRSIGGLISPLMNAIGRPDLVLGLNIVNVVVFPVTFFFATHWGIIGVATSWLVLYPTTYGIFLFLNCHKIHLRPSEFAEALSRPVLLAATVWALTTSIHSLLPGPGLVRLISTVMGGLAWFVGYLSLSEKGMLLHLKLAVRGE